MTATVTALRSGLGARVEVAQFASAVAAAATALPTRPIMPIMAGLVVTVDNGRLTVGGWDEDTAVTASAQADREEYGRVVVSGRRLAAIAKELPNRPVELEADGSRLSLHCGTAQATLPTMPVEDYPAWPETPEPIGTIQAGRLAEIVHRAAFAADVRGEHSVVALTGVHLTFADDVTVLATNRYRASVLLVPWKRSGVGAALLVPAARLIRAVKLLGPAGDVTVGAHSGGLALSNQTITVQIRTMSTKEYPVEQLPRTVPTRSDQPATVPIAPLAEAGRIAAASVDEDGTPIRLVFTDSAVRVEAGSGGRSAYRGEDIPCDHGGPQITVAINPVYLLDALAAVGGELAELSVTNRKKPILVTSPDVPADVWRHVVMPVSER